MPTISRWFVRSALASLLLGLGLGAASGWWGGAGLLAPTVLHLLVVGWLTQMVFGVAFWLFPKYSTDQPRGPEWLAWICWGSLNVGVLVRVVAEPLAAAGRPVPAALIVSALLQLVAAIAFAVNTWPRTRAR
ncbi:MAG: hypothetical protein JNJ80_15525 [Gemmatimonadetes bacterium]|nr:hypothetical protein [Gemmatimonadota bacterium]MCC7134248.1 hypothetical protein [Gemmatimonadales bacterium]